MKKIVLSLVVVGSALFAAETFQGCKELKLNEAKSIVSCPHGEYEVTYKINANGNRYTAESPKVVKIGESKQVVQYITQTK